MLLGSLLLAAQPDAPATSQQTENPTPHQVRFGVISDVHQDVMPDGPARIRAFTDAMKTNHADFIIQLGDFCWPHPKNKGFLDLWNSFPGPRYHVLGNHDMDGGYKSAQTVAFYGMPSPYYAFTAGPIRGIVLNGNEPGGKARGYKHFMGPTQLAWLKRELDQADRPVAIFIHQPFDPDGAACLENSAEVRSVLEHAQAAHPGLVLAVFSGHQHMDYITEARGIRYVHVNSASDWWLASSKTHRETYPHAVHVKYPSLKCVAAYRDPLWALVTIDLDRKEMKIDGQKSQWVGPDPWQRGEGPACPRNRIHPYISDFLGSTTNSGTIASPPEQSSEIK